MSAFDATQGISKLRKKVFKSAFSPQIQNSAITSQYTNKSFQGIRGTLTKPRPPTLNAKGKSLVFNNAGPRHPITKGTYVATGRIKKTSVTSPKIMRVTTEPE
jgi:hypothetical protein